MHRPVVDRRRHAPSTRRHVNFAVDQSRALPPVYRGRKLRDARGMFETDHADPNGGKFRWLISTCLAATVGAVAILVFVYGSSDSHDTGGIVPVLKRMRDAGPSMASINRPGEDGGLKWATPKRDLLQAASTTGSTRFVIHDTLKERRNNREYIWAKPYVRIVSRLGAVPSTYADVIPPFNPFRLYANSQPLNTGEAAESQKTSSDVQFKVVELLGGILPGEDGQELDTQEVTDLVRRTQESDDSARDDPIETSFPAETMAASPAAKAGQPPAANTSNIAKSTADTDDPASDIEGREDRVILVGKNDRSLVKVLVRAGADSAQATEMVATAKGIFPESSLAAGQEIHVALVPSLTEQGQVEPVQFSIFGEGHTHLVTVSRNSDGEFTASSTPPDESRAVAAAQSDSETGGQGASLYSAIYAAGLAQGTPPQTINQIMRIHAYDTDFRRRVRPGDQVETFYDAREDTAVDGAPGELLYTAITAGGQTSHFYRFRTPDGVVDYYDEQGNNAKKFLVRRPIRSDDVRLVSGFGVRFHPLLGARKMHTGVDWAAPMGTPIMAAGNGLVEEAGRKSGYGNYVRIKHANGYQTAYGHISRFAPGLQPGVKIRQGQTIAYVGCTGLCQGPHVHFEVLVNNRFVDPMSIQVPRERKLAGKPLADFQKERARIDELMHRPPVMVANKG